MHSTFSPLKRLGRSACPRKGVLGVARSGIDLCLWLWARVVLCLFFRGRACQAHASAELGYSSPTLFLPRLHCFLSRLHFGHAYSLQNQGERDCYDSQLRFELEFISAAPGYAHVDKLRGFSPAFS